MFLFLIPLLLGFVFASASAFIAAYSRRFGERGGKAVTAVLRNVFGVPLWIAGYLWAWLRPSPWVFPSTPVSVLLGWGLVLAGFALVVVGHIYVGMRSHLPSVRDTLVQRGVYANIRHPIYAGMLVMMLGLILARPTLAVLVASALAILWLVVQARCEEIDLLQRIPEYKEYMRQVPRFTPHLAGRGNR